MPNKADSKPEYKPGKPSRDKILRAAESVEVDGCLRDSTWARVERVMSGYVSAMDSKPPPAPDKAWATLSEDADDGVVIVIKYDDHKRTK